MTTHLPSPNSMDVDSNVAAMTAIHNPTNTALVYDLEGHVVDAHGRVEDVDITDPHLEALLTAGVLSLIPEQPTPAAKPRSRGSDGKDA